MSPLVFFWGTAIISTLLIIFNKYTSSIVLAFSLPFVSSALVVYIVFKRFKGMSTHLIFKTITKIYDDWTKEPERLPFDIDIVYDDEDFETPL